MVSSICCCGRLEEGNLPVNVRHGDPGDGHVGDDVDDDQENEAATEPAGHLQTALGALVEGVIARLDEGFEDFHFIDKLIRKNKKNESKDSEFAGGFILPIWLLLLTKKRTF